MKMIDEMIATLKQEQLDDDQKKEYLMRKTRAERDAYLKDQGLWEKYYKN